MPQPVKKKFLMRWLLKTLAYLDHRKLEPNRSRATKNVKIFLLLKRHSLACPVINFVVEENVFDQYHFNNIFQNGKELGLQRLLSRDFAQVAQR